MKTKFILSAMCLPLAFAACTNDELVTIDNGLANKEVVKMALSANYGADAVGSRMVNNNGTFLWDNTDVLGAAMPGASNGVLSNNRFGNNLTEPSAAADFTTQATTIAGEYTFYYPYNEDVTKNPAGGLMYSLPAVQEYDPTGVKMMDNNFMVAPRIKVDGKEPGTLTLPITMRSIYSYGLLNLKLSDILTSNNSNVTNLNIQKIIIEYASNVETDGRVNLSVLPEVDITTGRLEAIQAGTYKKDGVNVTYPSLKTKDLAEIRAALLKEADDKLVGASTVYKNGAVLELTTFRAGKTTNKIAKVVISCVDEQNPNGVELSTGGEFTTRVLLPTTSNAGTAADTKITVYTNKGIAEVAGDALAGGVMKANHTVNLANVNREGNETALYIKGALNTSSMSVEAISEADFIASMKQFAGMNAPAINVSINGFNLTPTAIAAIPSTAKVTFTSDVTFEGNMTLKNMAFGTKNVTFKSGTIVLESLLTPTDATNYTIKGDADVTFNALTSSNSSTVIVDGGSLTIEKYNSGNPVKQYVGSLSVINNGTLTVNTPLEASATITKGSLENNSTISSLTVAANGSVENNGTITTLANSGTVDNNGTISAGSNANRINQLLETSKIKLASNGVGAKIYTVAYSQTTVEDNDGDIIFVEDARVNADKNVAYEVPADFKASDLVGLVPAITKLIFNQDFTYDYEVDGNGNAVNDYHSMSGTSVTSMEFKGNLTLAKNWTLKEQTTIAFTGSKANLTGIQKILDGTGLTLTVGLPKIGSTPAVPTQLYIGNKLTVKTLVDVVLQGGATVWNVGTVTGSSTVSQPEGWDGTSIGGIVVDSDGFEAALNSVTDGSVIALNNKSDEPIELDETLVINNNITIKGGFIAGEIQVSDGKNVTLEGVSISGNTQQKWSAAVYLSGNVSMKSCTIDNENGRALEISPNAGNVVIEGCTFKGSNNTYINPPTVGNKVTVKNCTFVDLSLAANIIGYEGRFSITGNNFGKSLSLEGALPGGTIYTMSSLSDEFKEFCNEVLENNTFAKENKIAVTNNQTGNPENNGNAHFWINVPFVLAQ